MNRSIFPKCLNLLINFCYKYILTIFLIICISYVVYGFLINIIDLISFIDLHKQEVEQFKIGLKEKEKSMNFQSMTIKDVNALIVEQSLKHNELLSKKDIFYVNFSIKTLNIAVILGVMLVGFSNVLDYVY
jgi:hypothetical protein